MDAPAARGFDIGEAFRFGWDRFKANFGPLAIAALAVFLVEVLTNSLTRQFEGFASLLMTLVSFFVGQVIAMGWVRMSLKITDGKEASIADFFERLDLLLPYAIASLLFSIMVALGLVLFVVPGIILAIVFAFYGPALVDEELGSIDALKRSAAITRGNRGRLFLFGLAVLLLNVVGLLFLVVGVLVTSGISLLAFAYVYRRLSGDRPGEGPVAL
jgi:uncharacterized membrane protein